MQVKLVRLKEGQTIREKEDELIVSRNYYEIVPVHDCEKVYEGPTVPIPITLIRYLKNNEIKVFALIFDNIRRTGHCLLKGADMGKIIGISAVAVCVSLNHLIKMGLVYVKQVGHCKEKLIDFKMVAEIDRLCQGLEANAPVVLRRELKDIPPYDAGQRIMEILRKKCVLHIPDPIEDEEYI